MEAHLLAYLRQHGSTPGRLAVMFGFDSDELIGTLIEMGERGWVDFGTAGGITLVALTPAGRALADRREGERGKAMKRLSEAPGVVTKDELVAELRRGFGWTEEQIARNRRLRAERFWFEPAKGAWHEAHDPHPTYLVRGIRSLRKLLARTILKRAATSL
jgi:hypothetical protein